ncbi:MAG: hypothetical protein IPN33_24330 [Saprospiraceae bacterium]|nr:hypothetical protein [Saprospiraceae bacterium]
MENSKFLETLRTLNKRELTAFAKYLDGNYSNDKIALAVFDYIRAFFPDYRDEKAGNRLCVQENLWRRYPGS